MARRGWKSTAAIISRNSQRQARQAFQIARPGAYTGYRLTFLEVHGETRFQVAEIELEGLHAGASIPQSYRRELDLASAVQRVSYMAEGVTWRREYFCSCPAQVFAVRLTADRPAAHTGTLAFEDAHQGAVRAIGGRLTAAGVLANGLKYETQVRVVHQGGSVRGVDGHIQFTECDSLTVYLAAGTDYRMDATAAWRGGDPHDQVTLAVDRAAGLDYDELRKAHTEDYQSLFNRVTLDLRPRSEGYDTLPTDQRLKRYGDGELDLGLEALLFQFGRYLLISSSRPGGLPANLQGLWNNSNQPPWHCDYHSNINVQMNYWLAEPANLAECHEPFLDLAWAMREPSRLATRAEFGEVRGWTARTSHNIFGGHGWKWNVPASAWYAQHFYEHYAFGCDEQYLREKAYPMLKEICAFWEDHLKELPDATLVVPNGWSPEHGPVEDGCAHDQQIVWDLFNNTIALSRSLNDDPSFRDHIALLRDRLAGPQIGRWGQLQEWMVDRDDPDDRHRHTSHLFAVFPGRQISKTKTPELARAAEVSLEARGQTGDSRRSWTWPWRAAMWARLGNAEKAHDMVTGLLTYNMLPNLLATHPPMQMDGNFGITAAICEMLVQSHEGELRLLPALPAAWPTGRVAGLRARGGFTVDISWKDGQLVEALVRAGRSSTCHLSYADQRASRAMQAGTPWVFSN